VGDATLNSVSVTVDYKEGDVVECRYAPKNSALSSQPIVLTSKSPTVEPLEGLGKWEQTKNVFTCTPSASDSCQFKTYSANVSVNAETESTFCDDLGKQLQAEEANLKELKRLFDAGEISMIEYTMARTSILARIDQIRAIGKMEGCF
jgi:hypothetical protein